MIEKRFSQMCASNDYCIGWDNKLDGGLSIDDTIEMLNKLSDENEQLKQQIKDLRLEVLDSLHDADDIQCSCNPCVVEECVKKVVE